MTKFSLLICLIFVSCLNINTNVFNPQKEIVGDWLILYPKHVLKNDEQRNIYGTVQDSIIKLLGLKLISFNSDGEFIQSDSMFGKHGMWKVLDTGNIQIRSGGKGFENFKGNIVGIVNDTILIEEVVYINNENLKLIWHLKKIKEADPGYALFEKKINLWRQKPLRAETEREIKDRIIAMLKFYSLYFKVVSEESIYFTPARVNLPFTYFQHGVGLKTFDTNFSNCFFNIEDANKGYQLIRIAFENSRELEFPSGPNFVAEYSQYFERLANYAE